MRTARAVKPRTMDASSREFTARPWLAARPGGRAGWLGGCLLRQDQLVGSRDAEPILLLTVDDDELTGGLEEVRAPHDPPRRGTDHRRRRDRPRDRKSTRLNSSH